MQAQRRGRHCLSVSSFLLTVHLHAPAAMQCYLLMVRSEAICLSVHLLGNSAIGFLAPHPFYCLSTLITMGLFVQNSMFIVHMIASKRRH